MLRRLGVVAGQSSDIPPSAPTITSITPGNGSLSVNFTPPTSDGGRVITNYEFSTNNGNTWTTRSPASTVSPIVITGLNNGTNYTVRIRAVNLEGPGDSSDPVVQKPYTVPGQPQNVTVTNLGGGTTAPSFSISFTAPFSDGGDTITNYQYTLNGGSTWITRSPASTASPITITGVANNQIYTVGIRAVNAAGGGVASAYTSRRPLPHFTSVSASTPAVSTYPYISTQSDTYRTVSWTVNPDDSFSAGTWRVRLLDGATVVATSVNYTTTAETSGSFSISYANNTYWKSLTVSFEITDSSSQSTSSSTTVNVPGAESTTVTTWSTVNDTYTGSFGTSGYQSSGHNKQSGVIPSAVYTTAGGWDNNNGTQFRVDQIIDTSGKRYTELFATFIVSESILGTLVSSTATTAGPIINSSSMSITGVRYRTGIRNNTHFLIYDLHQNAFKGTAGTTAPPSGALLEGQPTAWYIASENVTQDGATWNSSGGLSIGLSRGNTTSSNPNYYFNISVVQRRGSTGTTEPSGRTIVTDAQYSFSIAYQKRQSGTATLYR